MPPDQPAANRTVLLTGAASGLGAHTALLAARRGHTVFGGVRDRAALDKSETGTRFRSSGVTPVTLDVLHEASIDRAVSTVVEAAGSLDVLVCCAGIAARGALEDMPMDEIRRVMDTNFYGTIAAIRRVLPVMRRQAAGTVIAVSSLSGLIGLPGDGAYAASKFALEGACEALAAEVGRFGVRVMLAQPGAFRTKLARHASRSADYPADTPYEALLDHLEQDAEAGHGDDPAVAAAEIVALFERPTATLRHPIGDQARAVTETLKTLGDRERRAYAHEVTGTGWWAGPIPGRPGNR